MNTVKDALQHCSNEELVRVWMNAARDTVDAKYRQLRREGGWFAEKSARMLNVDFSSKLRNHAREMLSDLYAGRISRDEVYAKIENLATTQFFL
ncbi:MAG: hypothetical protein LBM07_00040 [Culturomica sp.]|jgi:hypothetical protein|nr:hypothetical protein [Culturomica sp.]